jgi:hypothetical protein
MSEIQSIWDDITKRNFIESYLVLLAGILVLLVDLVGVETESVMSEVTLAVLSVLIYLSIKERREYKKLSLSEDIRGISAFYTKRDSLPSLGDLLNRAKKEIALYSVGHTTLVHQHLHLLEKKIEDGCEVKILIMCPRDEDGNANPNVLAVQALTPQSNTLARLEAHLAILKDWYDCLSEEAKRRVEVRTYWEHPGVTYTFIDREEGNGFVQVGMMLPTVHIDTLPHYVVTRRDGGQLFHTHCNSFNGLWTASAVLLSST